MSTQDGQSRSATYQIPKGLRKSLHGKRVALVDDVINAGSAMRATLMELHALGARPAGVGALLILGDTAPRFLREIRLPCTSVALLENRLYSK